MNALPLLPLQVSDSSFGSPADFDRTASHLVFRIDEQPYACAITPIQRLLRFDDASVQPSPSGAPAWEAGRLTFEDEAEGIPLVSLRTLWELPPMPHANRGRQSMLVLSVADTRLALLVDECLRVLPSLPAGSAQFRVPASLKGALGAAFESVVPWEESLLVILDLENLIQAPTSGIAWERQ